MADVRFYHMERQGVEHVLPALLNKALQGGHRIVVRCPNEGMAQQLNTHLWAYDPASFIPHGSEKDGHAEDQPVFLTSKDDNPNKAGVLILLGGAEFEDVSDFSMICEMLDGRDEQAVADARARWKVYKDADHDVTYWQQSPQGGWDKKAG